eukprot:TRINITY_DN52441_c0_g1_i1.p1 TRINITY_DN52441_c0_g1~~TRINITY_DN52441_c0_g1_i1.p1  ORF type:complete len:454 (-),score=60.84 TRINITY_DN52441_c0_g1_i1:41-1339(-)
MALAIVADGGTERASRRVVALSEVPSYNLECLGSLPRRGSAVEPRVCVEAGCKPDGKSSSSPSLTTLGTVPSSSHTPLLLEPSAVAYRLLFIPKNPVEATSSRNVCADSSDEAAVRKGIKQFAAAHRDSLADGWTSETANSSWTLLDVDVGDNDVGVGGNVGNDAKVWYGGCVVEGTAAKALLHQVPAAEQLLECPLRGSQPTGAAWAFMGINGGTRPLTGKLEHVDELRPGVLTMHAQLSGEKVWRLRPNAEADCWNAPTSGGAAPIIVAPGGRLEVCCRVGDRLLIDTGAWFHETSIPPPAPSRNGIAEFSLSIACDYTTGSVGSSETSSLQRIVTRKMCGWCGTPTATPPGAPPGTCGCTCCEFLRQSRREFVSFIRCSRLAQDVRARTMASFALEWRRRHHWPGGGHLALPCGLQAGVLPFPECAGDM